jgi:hypothetical protein
MRLKVQCRFDAVFTPKSPKGDFAGLLTLKIIYIEKTISENLFSVNL